MWWIFNSVKLSVRQIFLEHSVVHKRLSLAHLAVLAKPLWMQKLRGTWPLKKATSKLKV
jgi:hypothetical protein